MKRGRRAYLGFDLGASSGRAVLGTLAGRKLAIQQIHRFANGPSMLGGTLYWDFLSLWASVVDSMRVCAQQGYRELTGIGFDTWGVDFGLLGADGKLLGSPLCYRDGLTEGIERIVASKIRARELYRLTGHAPARVSTLSQLVALNSGPGAARLRSADALLMMPDLFRYFLCGHRAVELTAAGSTQLANVRRARWSSRLFETFRLPRRIMPEIVAPGTVVGRIGRDLAASTGLNRAPVVAVAGHDTASAAAAAPFADEGTAFLSCGTWSVLGLILDHPITTVQACQKGFVNEFGLGSVLFVKNMVGLYLFENLCRMIANRGGKGTYGQMIREASEARPFERFLDVNSPLFFVAEDPAPCVRRFLRGTGQRTSPSTGSMVRTLLEGLAWSYRAAVGDLAEVTGAVLGRICLVGGGSRNGLLCQMVADATGLTVIAGPAEATVAGNLAAQALATGGLSGVPDIRELVRSSFRLKTYRPESTDAWDRRSSRYAETVGRSKDLI